MIPTIPVIVVDSDGGFRKAVRQHLGGVAGIQLVGEAENLVAAQELLLKTRPRLVLLDLSTKPEEALSSAEKWRNEFPGLKVFATSASKKPDLILSAMRAGVSEYLSKPLEVNELRTALDRIMREIETEAVHSQGTGQMIAVFSKKGGLGVTTLSVNLAVALAAAGQQAVIADLAFDIGDVAGQLDLQPEIIMSDVIDKHGAVDSSRLQASLLRHPSGLYYLGEKEAAGGADAITAKQLHQILTHLRDSFQSVVLDLPHGFDSHTYEALQLADRILLVATAELSTVRATRYALQVFRSLGYDEHKVKIVLNRLSRKDLISEEQFCETVGYPVSFRIPSDYRSVIEAVNGGEPMTMGKLKSGVAKSISQLAQQFISPNGAGPAS
ncbi:MAG: response regulator [candidate division Zixibacteria bacterium]|nr:response regulator [candidate division Zixibacteria bacterium]